MFVFQLKIGCNIFYYIGTFCLYIKSICCLSLNVWCVIKNLFNTYLEFFWVKSMLALLVHWLFGQHNKYSMDYPIIFDNLAVPFLVCIHSFFFSILFKCESVRNLEMSKHQVICIFVLFSLPVFLFIFWCDYYEKQKNSSTRCAFWIADNAVCV